jgi:hypothetical protein
VVHGSGCASERSLIVAAAFDKGRSHKHVLDDELEIRFQEAHGAHQFREGKPRALLEVKRPQISTAIYEARLRGYDRAAKAARDNPSLARKK